MPQPADDPEDPILFVGDVHLGRRPGGLDAQLAELGLRPSALSPAQALASTVDHAIAVRARAVVFAGDVVESAKDRFEAFPALEAAAARLLGAGIEVVAVAGNHDSIALPRLVARLPAVRLLGAGGKWERMVLAAEGPSRPPVTLCGWSFPSQHYTHDPLDAAGAAAAFVRPERGALLAVLHADLDASASPYAPLRRSRLRQSGADAAFVGHVHAPDPLATEPFGYLGSLCGLDAGEPGVRGPWQVRVGGGVRAQQVALAPIHYDNCALDVTSLAGEDGEVDADSLHQALLHHARAWPVPSAAKLAVLRLTLVGRASVRAAVAALPAILTSSALEGAPRIITRVSIATLPHHDLLSLAAATTPTARLARMALALGLGDAAKLGDSGTLSDAAMFSDAAARLRTDALAFVARSGVGSVKAELPALDIDAVLDDAVLRALDAMLQARREVGR